MPQERLSNLLENEKAQQVNIETTIMSFISMKAKHIIIINYCIMTLNSLL